MSFPVYRGIQDSPALPYILPSMQEPEPDDNPRMRRRYIGVVICEIIVIAALWLLSRWFR